MIISGNEASQEEDELEMEKKILLQQGKFLAGHLFDNLDIEKACIMDICRSWRLASEEG